MAYTTKCLSASSRTETYPYSVDCPPVDFDADAHPIIAKHWFGVEPFRPIGEVAAEVVFKLKRRRQIEHVHRLGARAVGELLHEVAQGENLDRALEAYQRLTPDMLKTLGGDRFPPVPIYEALST